MGVSARAAAWAKIDRMLVGIAAAIPWAFSKQPNIESSDVRGINDVWNGELGLLLHLAEVAGGDLARQQLQLRWTCHHANQSASSV